MTHNFWILFEIPTTVFGWQQFQNTRQRFFTTKMHCSVLVTLLSPFKQFCFLFGITFCFRLLCKKRNGVILHTYFHGQFHLFCIYKLFFSKDIFSYHNPHFFSSLKQFCFLFEITFCFRLGSFDSSNVSFSPKKIPSCRNCWFLHNQ